MSNGADAQDCISVTFPSTLGGAALKGCGAQAQRDMRFTGRLGASSSI